jgi:hypothetical protein
MRKVHNWQRKDADHVAVGACHEVQGNNLRFHIAAQILASFANPKLRANFAEFTHQKGTFGSLGIHKVLN